MSKQTKHILLAAGVMVAAYVAYTIYKAVQAGVTGVENLIKAPFSALSSVGSAVTGAAATVADNATAAAPLLDNSLADQSAALDTTITANANTYAPGGAMYNLTVQTQGQAAADANWAAVQKNLATQAAATTAASPFSLAFWGI